MKEFSKENIPKNYADELDDVDYKIIELLQQNARMSAREIASQVFLSSTAIATRIERLQEKNIIRGFEIKINPVALGYYTKAFINVEVDPVNKKTFYPYIEKCVNVIQCNCVTGDYSMLLEVMFHNTMELDVFIGQLQRFGKTKTLIVFSTSVESREKYWKNDVADEEGKEKVEG